MMFVRLLTLFCLILAASGALAARVEIPLRVPLESIREALNTKLGYRDGVCGYLKAEASKLDAIGEQLRLGLVLQCQNTGWRSQMQLTLLPRIDADGRLRLRIVDSKVAGAGPIWDLSKRYVHPRLEQFSYDLGVWRNPLAEMLGTVGPAELREALAQLQLLQPRVEGRAVLVPVSFEVPDAWLTPPLAAASTAPLTEAEIEALEKALEPWDAFLVFAIKQLALDNEDSDVRKRLFTLLLDSRYELAAILSGETRPAGDPVRALFLDTWSELRAILADARYALFLEAGDALAALDRAAPGLGMRLSADGLRQLARSLRPGMSDDALAHDWAIDPQLGQVFGVENIPNSEPSPPPGRSWLEFFITSAYAADGRSLERWIPTRAELPAYGTRIGDLLHKTAASELERAKLAAPHDRVYRHLIPTTALIESCWRQYVLRGDKVTYLRSGSGSVGLMQINQRVWRGFYDIERLRWDTAYNIRAGAQILMRYVKDYAIPYAERSGDLNHVPRAAYAVYNAGPRAVGRFNKNPRHPREARVDEKLWTLYQGIASGGQADLRSCSVNTAAASR